ncbi:TetR/AcrR family transcriptional regulator|uniref:Transcriptional regulator, TetR family n=1 Tax=Dendrosporobacter quercicolus TaxID=146817 RepID=A0A1G9QM80_9FIRM|nr:TetR/AcrR family transcriptional regulator [Dendrosporobacter quercicolus]NSL48295.1 TetR/AcrR family transcriptional regulator [Dendrosporobacter quercicolus DSM 1736]SDM12109.1 transcriptional regulator, TetR family [Dendrosporobacter quercicolus]
MEPDLEHKVTTREKILHATLEIINNEGLENVTIRKITLAAQVNIAAVNYYFGSKENVINEALKELLDKLSRTFDQLEDGALPPQERLRNFLHSYADATLAYPDVFKNFLKQVITHYNDHPSHVDYIKFMQTTGWRKLGSFLQESGLLPNDQLLLMKIVQLFSALEFPLLLGVQTREVHEFDYYDQKYRYQYVELLMQSLLHKP